MKSAQKVQLMKGSFRVIALKLYRHEIGAGAAVIDDIPDNVTAVGVPAKVIKHH